MNIQSLFYSIIYAFLNVAGASTIKYSIQDFQLNSPRDYINLLLMPKVLLGLSVIFLSALVMFKALSLGKFSLVGPVATGINFLFTILVGLLFFKEKLSIQMYVGLLMILGGISLMSIRFK